MPGIVIHLAFMIDALLKRKGNRTFDGLASFLKKYRLETDIIQTSLIPLERKYKIKIPEDEIAFLTQMFVENKIKN
jgi:transcriptional regulatory protein LevR